jgi:hypothetical protein
MKIRGITPKKKTSRFECVGKDCGRETNKIKS